MSFNFETIVDNCTPRNALFCCRPPICLNNSPKLVAINANMDSNKIQSSTKVFPVCVPDLSDSKFYTNLISQSPQQNQNNERKFDSIKGSDCTTTMTPKNSDQQQSFKTNPINKSHSALDIRHGISLRRVTPPKSTVTVKKNETPMMNVVLRKVEKKLLEVPKPKHEKTPPPKRLTSAANSDLKLLKTKKIRNALNNSNAITKSKSTNDVLTKKDINANDSLATKPLPPVNLLKTQRPPLEIHKIEGDKIVIIRRIPRGQRNAMDNNPKYKSLTSLPETSANQVKISVLLRNELLFRFLSITQNNI